MFDKNKITICGLRRLENQVENVTQWKWKLIDKKSKRKYVEINDFLLGIFQMSKGWDMHINKE
jgi:hypothetical protein